MSNLVLLIGTTVVNKSVTVTASCRMKWLKAQTMEPDNVGPNFGSIPYQHVLCDKLKVLQFPYLQNMDPV